MELNRFEFPIQKIDTFEDYFLILLQNGKILTH